MELGSFGSKSLPTFQRCFTRALKLIFFLWKSKCKVLRTELGLFVAKAAGFNDTALCYGVTSFLTAKLLLFGNSVQRAPASIVHRAQTKPLFCSSIDAGTASPSISALFVWQQHTCLAVITSCCFMQSFTGAVAAPHPSAGPFIRNRGSGSRPRPPLMVNSVEHS